MANNDYDAGLKGDTAGHDIFSYSYQLGAKERERRARGDGMPGTEGMVAAGGGGILLVAFAVILAFLAFVAGFCVYPIAGAATLAAFLIGAAIAGNGVNFVGLVFMLMVPCYIAHYLCRPIEEKMGKRPGYRVFRQYWRFVVGTYAVHVLGTAFHLRSSYPDGAPFSGYVIDLIMTATGFFLLYLNSQRLDRNAGLEPVAEARIDRILSPVLNRLVPAVARDVRDTGMIRVKTDNGADLDIGVSGGDVLVGKTRVPLARLYSVKPVREKRGWLITGGVLMFFLWPVIVDAVVGDFDNVMPQIVGVAGWIASALAVLWGAVENTPAGKLGGPFRSTEIFYNDEKNIGTAEIVRFASAADERLFMQALKNGMTAAPGVEPAAKAA